MNQYVRIIGGIYRGKKLYFPDIPNLRPTSDRIKETLFNWLMHDIREAKCLDAFAGSGSLGFEAFSRGAKAVVLIENMPKIHAQLKRHLTAFNSEKLTLIHSDLQVFMEKTHEQFDIVFFDPPFSQLTWYEASFIEKIKSLVRLDGILYIESPHKIDLDNQIWHPLKSKKAGQVFYALYLRKA